MSKLYKVFGWKEFCAIAGRRGKHILWLGFISLLALLVLGFAESIEQFLREKMDNPHVRLVEVNWPKTCADGGGFEPFRKLTIRRYGGTISDVQGIVKENDYFFSQSGKLKYGSIGLVTKQSDILYNLAMSEPSEFLTPVAASTLMKDTSAIGLESFTGKEGIIVSRSFLRRLELPDNAPSIDIQMSCESEPVSLPVSAILKNLPSEVDVIMHDHLWGAIKGSRGNDTPADRDVRIGKSKSQFFVVPQKTWDTASNSVKKSFKVRRSAPSHFGGLVVKKERRGVVPNDWLKYAWLNPSTVLEMEVSRVQGDTVPFDASLIGVMFNSIDSVRAFADWIQNDADFLQASCPSENNIEGQDDCAIENQPGLKVDLSKIKSKEFLSLFNDIAKLLRYFLMASASMLLITRCNSLFQLHIEKNRASLGTLKAFGLSNKRIIGLYAAIAALMLFSAFALSMIVLSVLGPLSVELAKSALTIRPEDAADLTYHNMDLVQGFVAFVLFPMAFVSSRIRILLRLSPGALVFGRKIIQP